MTPSEELREVLAAMADGQVHDRLVTIETPNGLAEKVRLRRLGVEQAAYMTPEGRVVRFLPAELARFEMHDT